MSQDSSQLSNVADNTQMTSLGRTLAIIAITIGYVLNPLNGSLAITAYPVLSDYFDVPYAHMSALVMYFMAATAVAQPLAGGLGDFLGRKNIFLVGILGFSCASYMAANAESFDILLAWRVTQAVFSGVIMANGMAMVAQVAPREKIGTYVGLLTSTFVASTVLGFTLGGFLLQFMDWRAIFEINVGLGLMSLALAMFFIPRDAPSKARFTVLSFMGLPFLPLALGFQKLVQGGNPVLYFIGFVAAFVAIAYGVSRSEKSIAQLKSFMNLRFSLGCFALFFSIALHFAVMFTLPAWSNVALGLESGVMGIYFSVIAGSQVLASPIFGKMIDSRGDKQARLIAVITIALSLLLMLFWLNKVTFAIALALLGCGMAAAQLVAQRTSLLAASEDSRALAMGIFSSYRSVGGLSGNALAALVLAGYVTVVPESGARVIEWGLVLFLVPLALSLFALREKRV